MRYDLDDLPLQKLLTALTQAEDMLARLDERALRHAVAEGFRERSHFFDATAALWVGGELVHIEDLVLHDAHMDVRAPTHELTIAHAVLRARRRLWNADPDWGLSVAGIEALRSGLDLSETISRRAPEASALDGIDEVADEDDAFASEFAEIDAILARSERVLEAGKALSEGRSGETNADPLGLVHDEEWDEEARLQTWRTVMRDADKLPPALAAAVLFDAWERIEPLRRQHWLGSLLVSAYLRGRGKLASHLLGLNIGLKSVRHERRRSSDRTTRLLAFLEAMIEAADAGLKELDRLTMAKSQMERRMKDRRSSSSLPGVIDLVLSRPIVSVNMVARHVDVTGRGALKLVGELGLREMTGRGRYRAWGII
jgi:hypothetical protein